MTSFFDPEGTGLTIWNLLSVVILGPYKPISAMQRLVSLRDCLRSEGFSRTNLVRDLEFGKRKSTQTPQQFFSSKSRHFIRTSDLAIFVFYKNADIAGVTSELIYTIHALGANLGRTYALFENTLDDFSTQIAGPVVDHRFQFDEFESDAELCDRVKPFCIKVARQMYYELKSRR